MVELEEVTRPVEATDGPLIVVARGQHDLIRDLRAVFNGVGRIRIIEDRRRDRTLLPRQRHSRRRRSLDSPSAAVGVGGPPCDGLVTGHGGDDADVGRAVSTQPAGDASL